MNVSDYTLCAMVASHLFNTPGVEMVPSPSGSQDGHSYTAWAVVDMHDTVELGPWKVCYSINSIMHKLTVVMQDCDESAVEGCFVNEIEGKRQGVFTTRKAWETECGGFGEDYQREIVLAILTNAEFHAELPSHLVDYQSRCQEIAARSKEENA